MIHRPSSSKLPGRRPGGFTLIELLVVMGIIVLLVAILLPVAGRVRIQAQTAKTQSTMASIAGAMEQYYLSNRSYPGMFSNPQLAAGVTSTTLNITPAATGAGPEFTMTENATAGLVGGIDPGSTASGPQSTFTAKLDATTTIGKGPISMSPVPVNRVRAPAYIEWIGRRPSAGAAFHRHRLRRGEHRHDRHRPHHS